MRLRVGTKQPRNVYLIDSELPGGERLCGQFDDEAIALAVVAAIGLAEELRRSAGGRGERELLSDLVEAMEDIRSNGVPPGDNPECWYEARALLARTDEERLDEAEREFRRWMPEPGPDADTLDGDIYQASRDAWLASRGLAAFEEFYIARRKIVSGALTDEDMKAAFEAGRQHVLTETFPRITMEPPRTIAELLGEVSAELGRARQGHAPFNSDHEAYAVILEEVEEYWDEVRKKRSERDGVAMRTELIQIAAMAARAAIELHGGDKG